MCPEPLRVGLRPEELPGILGQTGTTKGFLGFVSRMLQELSEGCIWGLQWHYWSPFQEYPAPTFETCLNLDFDDGASQEYLKGSRAWGIGRL